MFSRGIDDENNANNEIVNNILVKKTNPEPIFVILVAMSILVMLVVLYMRLYVRPALSGVWVVRRSDSGYEKIEVRMVGLKFYTGPVGQKPTRAFINVCRSLYQTTGTDVEQPDNNNTGVLVDPKTIKWLDGSVWVKQDYLER